MIADSVPFHAAIARSVRPMSRPEAADQRRRAAAKAVLDHGFVHGARIPG